MKKASLSLILSAQMVLFSVGATAAEGYKAKMDPAAQQIETELDGFRPGPDYSDHKYDWKANWDVYGAKHDSGEPFYPFFFGRRMYPSGEFDKASTIFGKRNSIAGHFMGFGDLRLAYAYSDDGTDEQAEIVTRMNLDLDLKITDTERLHAFVRPFDKNGRFTRFSFGDDGFKDEFDGRFDFNLEALFFEGEVGSILSGITGSWSAVDLPFAVGLMPLIFHNGIWFNDFVTGVAFTIPAMNSRTFDISNMDISFFAVNDEINSGLAAGGNNENDSKIFGFNTFIEWFEGYMELGYAYTEDEIKIDGDHSYHNLMLSWTARWKNIASMSYRFLGNFGQEDTFSTGVPAVTRDVTKNADGFLALIELSWGTHRPYDLVPYSNFFFGVNTPQAVARQNDGVLVNTGILFETDGMTAFPTMDATARDTWGGAIGIQYVPNLIDYQIVLETAMVRPHGNLAISGGDQYGVGLRFQKPLSRTLIFRADAIHATREDLENIYGVRTELRWKY